MADLEHFGRGGMILKILDDYELKFRLFINNDAYIVFFGF